MASDLSKTFRYGSPSSTVYPNYTQNWPKFTTEKYRNLWWGPCWLLRRWHPRSTQISVPLSPQVICGLEASKLAQTGPLACYSRFEEKSHRCVSKKMNPGKLFGRSSQNLVSFSPKPSRYRTCVMAQRHGKAGLLATSLATFLENTSRSCPCYNVIGV